MVLLRVESFLLRDTSSAHPGQPLQHFCDRFGLAASSASTSARKCACLTSRQASVLVSSSHSDFCPPERRNYRAIDAFWSLVGVPSQLQKRGSDCDDA